MSLQMLRKSAIISSNRESGLTIEYWFATFSPENANFVRETQYRPIVHTRFLWAHSVLRVSQVLAYLRRSSAGCALFLTFLNQLSEKQQKRGCAYELI